MVMNLKRNQTNYGQREGEEWGGVGWGWGVAKEMVSYGSWIVSCIVVHS